MISFPSTGRRRAWPLFAGRGWVATGLVAAVVVIYVVRLAVGHAWFVDAVREVALAGLVAGLLSRLVGGREALSPRWPALVVQTRTGDAPAGCRVPIGVFR